MAPAHAGRRTTGTVRENSTLHQRRRAPRVSHFTGDRDPPHLTAVYTIPPWSVRAGTPLAPWRIEEFRHVKKILAVAIAVWGLADSVAFAKSTASPPALPAPTGAVVNVSTEAQLQAAVSHIASNT